MAYVYRCINNLCRSQPRQSGPLTAKELNSAQMKWVQNCQQQSYPREIASIKSKPVHPGIMKPPFVRQLRLFADDAGLLRCGGRIHNAFLSKVAKFPYLLPQNNYLTSLIVNHVHVSLSYRCGMYPYCSQTVLLDTIRTSMCQETITPLCNL